VAGALHGNFSIGGTAIELRASVGMACAERHGATAEDLVSRADVAMYAAKRDRRDTAHGTVEDAAVIGASRSTRG
jgi:diguanylate cyclase (GGDEF)-like protein